MTTKELAEELLRDDQNRKVVFKLLGSRDSDPCDLEIDRITMLPEPTIYLIEK